MASDLQASAAAELRELAHVAPLEPRAASERAAQLCANVERVIKGKREAVELCVAALLARGHVLIEDVPGVGKTTLAQALARSLGVSFSRIQFTSDLLPSDILGVSVFNQRAGSFEFKPGPIFAHVILADEINRTTPRTQSCLLEAMNDGHVSLDGVTRALPRPFFVLATQNPREYQGTYPLPESQLDRFLMRVSLGYPAPAVEREILLSRGASDALEALRPVADDAQLLAMQAAVAHVRAEPTVIDYLMKIVEATRKSPMLSVGVSTRGALALFQAAQSRALVGGRDFITPGDVKMLAGPCLAHRVVPATGDALEPDRREAARILGEIVERVPVPT